MAFQGESEKANAPKAVDLTNTGALLKERSVRNRCESVQQGSAFDFPKKLPVKKLRNETPTSSTDGSHHWTHQIPIFLKFDTEFTFSFFFFFFFSGCAHGKGSNLCHRSDKAKPLTIRPQGNS